MLTCPNKCSSQTRLLFSLQQHTSILVCIIHMFVIQILTVLCLFHFQARVDNECVGAIVCKLDFHKKIVKRGYIAMLAVDSSHRKRKIGSTLVQKAIQAMIAEEADEVQSPSEYRPFKIRTFQCLVFIIVATAMY